MIELPDMTPLGSKRQEAFVQALARGVEGREAAIGAGYKAPRNWGKLVKNPRIATRLANVRRLRAGGASADVHGLIDWLVEMALEARGMKDLRAIAVARACLDTAAKLKRQLPGEPFASSASDAAILAELDRDVSDEEWMRRYGPEPPGGKMGDVGPW
jgi:hypothetical protein